MSRACKSYLVERVISLCVIAACSCLTFFFSGISLLFLSFEFVCYEYEDTLCLNCSLLEVREIKGERCQCKTN